MKRKKILVIDNDVQTTKTVNEYLDQSKFNFEVLSAASAHLALEISNTVKPDIILANCEMPDMPGADLMQELKSNTRTSDIPVILTASPIAYVNDLYSTLSQWPVHYLGKPINKTDLNIQINTALVMAGPLREIEKQRTRISQIQQLASSLLDIIPTALFYKSKDGSTFGYNRALGKLFKKVVDPTENERAESILPGPLMAEIQARREEIYSSPE